MTDKQQIEEMAKIIASSCYKSCSECNSEAIDGTACIEVRSAEALYNAGYRKQSEGEWITDDLGNVCTKCGRTYDPDFDIKPRIIKQFKYCPNCGARMKGENR